MDDYWFDQRYLDALWAEHVNDHPDSNPSLCPWCNEMGRPESKMEG